MTHNVAKRIPAVPIACFWEITDECNLRCIHCEQDAGRRSPDELSTDQALELAGQLAEAGCESVCLTGGEPLCRRDWPAIAAELSKLDVGVTIITNGVLVDEAAVEEMSAAGVTGLSVSLDGDRSVHDAIRIPAKRSTRSSFDSALRAIRVSVSSPLKTAVITQVHRRNIDDLERMHAQLRDLGVDVWQVQICMPLGRLLKFKEKYLIDVAQIADLHETLAELIERGGLRIAVADNIGYYGRQEPVLRGAHQNTKTFWTGCLAGCRVVALCANGDVKGCPSHPREFVVGNVRETPFGEIWRDRQRFSYNTAWQPELLEGGCAECPFGELCRAGCTTMAYAVTGTIYDNPFCIQQTGARSDRGR